MLNGTCKRLMALVSPRKVNKLLRCIIKLVWWFFYSKPNSLFSSNDIIGPIGSRLDYRQLFGKRSPRFFAALTQEEKWRPGTRKRRKSSVIRSYINFFFRKKVRFNIILSSWTVQLTSTHSSLERRFSSLSRSITAKAWSVGANKVMLVNFIAEFSIICEKILKFGSPLRISPMLPAAGFSTLSITWMIPLLAPWFETTISPPCMTIVCQMSERINKDTKHDNKKRRGKRGQGQAIDSRRGR